MKCRCTCGSNSLIWCSVMLPISKCCRQLTPCRERQLLISVNVTKPPFFLSFMLAENNKRNIPSLVSFSWYAPCSSLTGKCQYENIEPDNRQWQCCFSEVSVTLQRIAPESGKSNQAVTLPGGKGPQTTEWFIQILWSDRVIFQLLWDWRQTEKIWTVRSEAQSLLYSAIM